MSEFNPRDNSTAGFAELPRREVVARIAFDGDEPSRFSKPEIVQELVRCKDCKHYILVDESCDGEVVYHGCGVLSYRYRDDEPRDPDGFCAWAERVVAGD